MTALLLIAWRNARAGLGRTAMTVMAVCLGVAFLSGSLSVSDTLAKNLSALVASQYDSVDVVVRGEKVAFTQRADLPEDLVTDLAAVDGVAVSAGIVEGFAQPVALDGTPLGSAQQPGLGRTWVEDPELQSLPLAAGRGPEAPGEAALDATTAESGGVAVGDQIQVATAADVVEVEVVGIVEVSSGTGSALTWFEPTTAQALLGTSGLVQEIFLAADPGFSPDQLADAVAAELPNNAEALTGAQAAEESQEKVEAVFGFFQVILLVFVGIGLIVCTFIVFNTFAVLTAQRTRQLATLRAMGARQRQVTLATLAEGAVIGSFGAVLGVILGYFMTTGLIWLIAALGLGEMSGGVVMRPTTIVVSIAIGLVVTLVGAYPAARDAGRAPPVSAMRQASVTPTEVPIGRILAGVVVMSLAVLLIGRGATTGYPDGLVDVGLGVGVLILGLILWGRSVLVYLVELLSPAIGRLGGLPGELAGRNSVRDPKRTTVTAGSLALGLTLVSALAVLTASTKATLDDAADTSLTAQVLVLPLVGNTPMPAPVTDQVRSAEGVSAVSPILFDSALINSKPTFVTGVDPQAIDKVLALDMVEGDVGALADGEVLVAEQVARLSNLRLGQTVRAVFNASGPVDVRIGGIFAENVYAGFYLMDEDQFVDLTGKSGVWYVYAATDEGAEPDAVAGAVATAIEGTANTQAMTREQYTAYQDQLVDQAMAGIYFMLMFAVIVAVVGVANTVALSVSERVREIGMLRAIGMQRAQVARMIRYEAVLTSMAGAVLGIVVGLVLGATLRATLETIGFTILAIPWGTIGWFLVASALAGVLAAWLPARRASKMEVLDAIHGS